MNKSKTVLWSFGFLFLVSSAFTETKNAKSYLTPTKSVSTKYYYVYHAYNGTWSGSRTTGQKVFFAGTVTQYDCSYYKDCWDIEDRAKKGFKSTLTSTYETTSSGASFMNNESNSRVEESRTITINYYKRLGYQIMEI